MAKTLVIFRVSDGYVSRTHLSTGKIEPAQELGDKPGFSVLVVDQLPPINGGDYQVVGGRVVVIPVPRKVKRDQDRRAGYAQLRSLGLTKDHLKAIFGAGAGA